MENHVLGVDIGGSHATVALVDLTQQKIVPDSKMRADVDAHSSAEAIVASWCKLISKASNQYKLTSYQLGIAMPGPFDYDEGVSYIKGLNKFESLYGLNVKKKLSSSLSLDVDSIRMINDAAAFLRGEVYGGAAKGFSQVIGVTLGTGVGTAIHRDGITADANLGPSPYRDSITDDYFSTRWFENEYKVRTGYDIHGVKGLVQLHDKSSVVKDIFKLFVSNFASFIEEFIQRENSQCVVLGGNIAQAHTIFLEPLTRSLGEMNIQVPIKIATLGEDAAILGAAKLF